MFTYKCHIFNLNLPFACMSLKGYDHFRNMFLWQPGAFILLIGSIIHNRGDYVFQSMQMQKFTQTSQFCRQFIKDNSMNNVPQSITWSWMHFFVKSWKTCYNRIGISYKISNSLDSPISYSAYLVEFSFQSKIISLLMGHF